MKLSACFLMALIMGCKPAAKSSSPKLSSISISLAQTTLPSGSTESIAASAVLSDGSTSDVSSQVSWGTSDTDVAKISCENGGCALTGGNEGVAVVSAQYEGVQGTVSITVSMPSVVSIQAGVGQPSIPEGTTTVATVEATLSDGSGFDVTNKSALSSSAPAVATVSCSGGVCTVTGVSAGLATLTATMGSLTSSVGITVTGALPAPDSVSIAAIGTLHAGDQPVALHATGEFRDGGSEDISGVAVWTSSNETVATISDGGLLTPLSEGSTTVNVTFDGIDVDGGVTAAIGAALTTVIVTPTTVTLDGGAISLLTANGVYADGTTSEVSEPVEWTASPPSGISISSVSGGTSTEVVSCLMAGGGGSVTAKALVAAGPILAAPVPITCE